MVARKSSAHVLEYIDLSMKCTVGRYHLSKRHQVSVALWRILGIPPAKSAFGLQARIRIWWESSFGLPRIPAPFVMWVFQRYTLRHFQVSFEGREVLSIASHHPLGHHSTLNTLISFPNLVFTCCGIPYTLPI
ncbi:hypothetical protein TNCV_3005411 [Trichonephila clavipes]|nr:hypothetical protein TNCV_3005411 [Trichonephila clavipes]